MQSVGKFTKVGAISESTGIVGNSNDGLYNFKKVSDPDDKTKAAYLVQAAYNDPETAGGRRTELYWTPSNGYTPGTTYWQAFRIRIGDNVKNMRAGDGALLWQIHDGADAGLSPSMSLNATGGGSSSALQWVLRYSTNGTIDRSTIATRYVHQQTGYPTNKWITYVVQFKPHYAPGNGAFFKVWQDGQLIVNDTLPNDYNTGQASDPNKRSYQKLGVYHYYQDRWSAGDYLTAYYKGLVTYIDDGKITEPMMRSLIESR